MLVIPMWVKLRFYRDQGTSEAFSLFYSPQFKVWWKEENNRYTEATSLNRWKCDIQSYEELLLAQEKFRVEHDENNLCELCRISYSCSLLKNTRIAYVSWECPTTPMDTCQLPWKLRVSESYFWHNPNKYRYGYATYPIEENVGRPKNIIGGVLNTERIELEGLVVFGNGDVAWRDVRAYKVKDSTPKAPQFKFRVTEWTFYNKYHSITATFPAAYELTRVLYPDEIIQTCPKDEEVLNRVASRIFLNPARSHSVSYAYP